MIPSGNVLLLMPYPQSQSMQGEANQANGEDMPVNLGAHEVIAGKQLLATPIVILPYTPGP